MARKKRTEGTVNQQELANRLKISRTTVSRCFTNHPAINPENRSRVFQLAASLGYVHLEMRNPERRPVRNGWTFGVLVCTDLEHYFHGRYESPGEKLMEGVAEFAQLENIRLDVRHVPPSVRSLQDPVYRALPLARKRRWSGVLLIYPFPDEVVRGLARLLPVVSLVEHAGLADIDCVDVDHHKGIAAAYARLVAAGHRRVGFFTLPYAREAGWSLRRYGAFLEVLAQAGCRPDPRDLVNVPPEILPSQAQSYDRVAARIRDGVTGWICAADHMAFDLADALAARHIVVPRQASLTGFDGLKIPARAPQLSTVLVPYREIGLIGAKRLAEIASKRFSAAQHILVQPGFRAGETVGPTAGSSRRRGG
jgi:DNA-binding LacI/PurR family transcriptional regulator